MYLFNARAEGNRNKNNSVNYSGSKDIITKPAFRKPIRSQRCLIPADAFIEGTSAEGLNEPFLVFLRNKQRPFAFAGIYDIWENTKTGEEISSFSIITTFANQLMQKIPHHRSPVILHRSMESEWLNSKTPLSDITQMLEPYDSNLMNAYPISAEIKNPKANSLKLIKPVGKPVYVESTIGINANLELQGMGARKKPQK
jgi:putative SOS response-associated peptidase YedK